jgi:hypothetical protein
MKRIAKKINDNDENIVINLINPNPPEPKKVKPKREKLFNEKGQRIKKNGELYCTDMSKAQEGLKKWKEAKKKQMEELELSKLPAELISPIALSKADIMDEVSEIDLLYLINMCQ